MPADRFFLAKDFQEGARLQLEGTEHHHLFHVMRVKEGEVIEVLNGRGALAQARVEKSKKRETELIIESLYQEKPGPKRFILAQALPRRKRLDLIIEKGTELGMDALWLFPGERSEKKELGETKPARLDSIAVAAMKQSGRLFLPEITVKPPLLEWEKMEGRAFFGDLSPEAPPFAKIWQEKLGEEALSFFVGPESGFSEEEVAYLREKGVEGVKLHANILRTDTAPLVALSTFSMAYLLATE